MKREPNPAELQVVYAPFRGDRCYENRDGWFWHSLDELGGIDEETIRGPFDTQQEAHDDAKAQKGSE